MECKLKAFLTSWLPWKLLNKSENLFYFPTHLRLLVSVWKIKQDRFMPSWKEIMLDWKGGAKVNPPTPPCPSPSPGGTAAVRLRWSLRITTACRSQARSIPPSPPASPQHLLLMACSLYMHKAPTKHLPSISGTPTFHAALQGVSRNPVS